MVSGSAGAWSGAMQRPEGRRKAEQAVKSWVGKVAQPRRKRKKRE